MPQYELLPQEKPFNTGVTCIHCQRGTVVAEVELPSVAGSGRIGGPLAPPPQPKVHSFHCNNPECLLVVAYPYDRPNMAAEIEKKINDRFWEEQARQERERFGSPLEFIRIRLDKNSRRKGRRFRRDNGIG